MRDMAPAFGAANVVNSTASHAARNVFVITAPQCDV
jgi:hypothetical protein